MFKYIILGDYYNLDTTTLTNQFLNYVLLFGLAFSINYLIIPIIIKLGNHFGIQDIPNYRKQHKKPIVRLGGIGFIISFKR